MTFFSREYGEMSKENYNRGFRDLIVYQKSYKAALEIFELTKTFLKKNNIR